MQDIPYDILRKLYAQKPLHISIVVYNKHILMINSLIVNQNAKVCELNHGFNKSIYSIKFKK